MADTTIRLWHFGSYGFGWKDAGMDRQRNSTFVFRFTDQAPEKPS